MKKIFLLLIFFSALAHGQTTTTLAKLRASTNLSPYTVYRVGTDLFIATTDAKSADDGKNILVSKRGTRYYRLQTFQDVPAPLPVVYKNAEQSFTASCPSGFTGTLTVTIPAGTLQSTVSVSDANNKALAAAQQQAELGVVCKSNPPPLPLPSNNRRFGPFNLGSWKGSISKGSNTIHFAEEVDLSVGDQIIFEFAEGRGHEAFKNWPKRIRQEQATPSDGLYARNPQTGNTERYSAERGWEVFDKWDSKSYYSYSLIAKVTAINGRDVAVDQVSAIDYSGTVYFDNLPVFQKLYWTENGFDLSKYGLGKGNDVYVSEPIATVNLTNARQLGNGVTLKSPRGCVSPGILNNNGNGWAAPYTENITLWMQGEYKFYTPYYWTLPDSTETWYTGPWVNTVGFGAYSRGCIYRNVAVFNPPSYGLQGGEGLDVDGLTIWFDSTKFPAYTGWPAHILGGTNGHIKNYHYYCPFVQRAGEIQQATNASFENCDIINGTISQNQGENGLFKNVRIRLKSGAGVLNPGILSETILQVNQLLSGENASGVTYDSVSIIQEGYLTPAGDLMRSFVLAKDGVRNVTVRNCYSEHPDVKPAYTGNNYAAHFSANADGLVVDGFTTKGSANKIFGCFDDNNADNAPFVVRGAGKASVSNVRTQKVVVTPTTVLMNVVTECPAPALLKRKKK